MRRPATLGHYASGSYAAKIVSPAKDDKVRATATAAANRSPLVIHRNSSSISAKNSSPLMISRKMSIQQSQGLKRNSGSSSIGNVILQRAASACTTPIKGHNPLWKPSLCSKITIGITAVLLIAVLIETLFLSRISSPNINKGRASPPSFFLRKKKPSMQQFIQNPRSDTQQLLGTDNVVAEHENVDATTEMKNYEPITIQEYDASNTNKTFCPKDGFASFDDDDAHVKGPVIDMTGLRQLSNRDSHFKDSKCPRNIQETKIGTTLVTQATLDRLPFVKEICQRWSSPMIVVVCLSPSQVDSQDWKSTQERYDRLCPQLKMVPVVVDDMERDYKYPINRLRNRGLDEVQTSHVLMTDVDFIPSENLDQAVLKAIQIHMEQDEEEEQKNDRSNRRRRQYMSDKLSISSVIRSILRFFQFGQEYRYHYRAFVIPAFERKVKICQDMSLEECIQYTSKFEEFMPRSIESLKQCMNSTNVVDKRQNGSDLDGTSALVEVVNSSIESSKCIVFHSDYFPKGHGDTQSAQWLKEGDENSVRAIPCINIDAYEPYLALPWCPSTKLNHYTLESTVTERVDQYDDNNQKQMPEPWAPLTPYYDERFYGYGKNKLQHIFQLQQTGYAFSVIPAIGFLTHHPHPDSNTKIHWKERSQRYVEDQENVKVKMKRLYKKFKCEMEQEYERLFPLPTESC